MAALAWLLIPVMGCLVAALWGSWAARRRTGAGGVHDASGVRRHEAFRAAMERPSLADGRRRGLFGRRRPAPVPAPASAASVPRRGPRPPGAAGPSPAPADG